MRVFTAGHELAVVPLLVVSFAIVFRALSASGSGGARRSALRRWLRGGEIAQARFLAQTKF